MASSVLRITLRGYFTNLLTFRVYISPFSDRIMVESSDTHLSHGVDRQINHSYIGTLVARMEMAN